MSVTRTFKGAASVERDSRERVAASRPELADRPDGPFWSRRHLPALLRAGSSHTIPRLPIFSWLFIKNT